MAIDARIPLQAQPVNFFDAYQQGRQARYTNKLNELKLSQAEQEAETQNQMRQLMPGAIQGNKEDLAKVAALDPDTSIKVGNYLSTMNKAEREQMAHNVDMSSRLLLGVEKAPPEMRPQAYQAALLQAQQMGVQLDDVPEQYDPQWVQRQINLATTVQDQLKQTFEREKFQADLAHKQATLGETRRHHLATETNSRANQNTFGSPIQAIGPDGQPIFVQVDKAGNARPLQGVTPQPKSGMRIVMGPNGEMTYESGAPGGRPLPSKAINDIAEAGSAYEDVNRLTSTFKPEYGGYKSEMAGDVVNWAKRTFGDDSGQAQWWQDYQNQKNIVRNTLFGAALTATEKAEFDKAQINPGMSSQEIEKNLDRQERAARRAAAKLARTWRANGYSEQAIQEALGGTADLLDEPGASGVVVRLPDGTQVEFPDQQSADRYKKAAGLN